MLLRELNFYRRARPQCPVVNSLIVMKDFQILLAFTNLTVTSEIGLVDKIKPPSEKLRLSILTSNNTTWF